MARHKKPLKRRKSPYKRRKDHKEVKRSSIRKRRGLVSATLATISNETTVEKETAWTEVLVASHILADEAHNYIEQNAQSLSEGEKRMLSAWVRSVQNKLQKQNTVVHDNIGHVKKLNQSEKQINKLRDDILSLQTQIRASESSNDQTQNRSEQSIQQGASRFLRELEKLRR